MKADNLDVLTQQGLRRFCADVHDDDLVIDAISSLPESWAWIWFQLREAEDKPEWFPRGKWATIQRIEALLCVEAAEAVRAGVRA